MKNLTANLKWRKLILLSVLLGGLLGVFDSSSFSPTAYGDTPGFGDGCPSGQQCRPIGCDGAGQYCTYTNIYGLNNCPTNVRCPNIVN